MTEDETVEWHHQFDGHEFKQTPGDSEGQGRLVYHSSWDHKELDTKFSVISYVLKGPMGPGPACTARLFYR